MIEVDLVTITITEFCLRLLLIVVVFGLCFVFRGENRQQ